jgi:hypothetical protein
MGVPIAIFGRPRSSPDPCDRVEESRKNKEGITMKKGGNE